LFKTNSHHYGLEAEEIARQHFIKKGFQVLARRYKTPYGELDLILEKNLNLIFLEVKARRRAYSLESIISNKQIARNLAASEYFLAENPCYSNHSCSLELLVIAGKKIVEQRGLL